MIDFFYNTTGITMVTNGAPLLADSIYIRIKRNLSKSSLKTIRNCI